MTSELAFGFEPDLEAARLEIRRDFAAPRDLVWECYTKADLLDRWFAPRPMRTETRSMEFREGGHWHFAMIDPDGNEYWSRFDFEEIAPKDRLVYLDGFSDPDGSVASDMPRASTTTRFEEAPAGTTVRSVVQYASAGDLQKVIDMGMEQGLASTLDRLDDLLVDLSR